jgi:signal transduction protein with GAF and PtsI domain
MPEKENYFLTICKVSRAFGTTLEKDELLDLIVQSAIDTMDGKAACLFLQEDRDSQHFIALAQKGLSKNYLHAKPKEARKAAEELLEKGYIAIHDATADPNMEHRDLKRKEGIASILVVPVMVKSTVIGVLSLYTATRRKFTRDEIAFLTALAEQGGMAIEHARLVDQIRKNTDLFHKLAVGMNDKLELKNILEIMTEGVAKAMGVKAASVRLLDSGKKTLQLVSSYGLSEKYLNKGPISAEQGIGEALQGQVCAIDDACSARGVQYKKEKKEEGIASILSLPIKAGTEVIGVLRLYGEKPREFTEDEIMFGSALAQQGGLAIQNASCVLMLREDLKDLKDDIWTHKSWF